MTGAILGAPTGSVNDRSWIQSLGATLLLGECDPVAFAPHAAVDHVPVVAIRWPGGETGRTKPLALADLQVMVGLGGSCAPALVDVLGRCAPGQQQHEQPDSEPVHRPCMTSRHVCASARPRSSARAMLSGSKSSGRSMSGADGVTTCTSTSG